MIEQPWELKALRGGLIYVICRLLRKVASFQEVVSDKRFVCCAITMLYSIDSMVGQSIASICNLGDIFTLMLL